VIYLALLSNHVQAVPSRGSPSKLAEHDLSEPLTAIEQLVLQVGWLEQRRFSQDVAGFGLTPAQFFVLRSTLSHDSSPTMGALAYDTLQHCATVSGIVDRLEKMGLVTRHRDYLDRRQMLVELTAAGHEVLGRIRACREKRLRETLTRLSPHDALELLRLLRTYLEAFREQYENPDDPPPHHSPGTATPSTPNP